MRIDGDELPAIVGTPLAGERLGDDVFDGESDIAVYPGDLPADPDRALALGRDAPSPAAADVRFLRFRPPRLARGSDGRIAIPSIRLDKAVEFLVGDALA
jgi:predicted YcjX-like family ATPase